jgi:hypothetical protein
VDLLSVIPILSLAGTLWYGIWQQYRKSQDDFAIKAAEIILNTDNADVTSNKAKALGKIFPDRLPENFASKFDPSVFSQDEVTPKKELMALLAAKPEHSKNIVAFWRALFPDDQWLKSLEDTVHQRVAPEEVRPTESSHPSQ